ncbi:Rieske 2Fe-2S domain-containing protein [uncultured Spongiibacter sp.]|uniref:Rieske 2Fe-2S domain-containing protein n=1 Tax=Spongiibacter marinus TaxID=354246 RepID=UPI002592E4EF|nr:Rieske 2Fe-2S domain-containing protein [uncultured Spongiibacter sp.]
MAKAADYGLGPNTFPRGWFLIAESSELGQSPLALRFFARDFALYRGEDGKPVLLDAYCPHMQCHIAASDSAVIAKEGAQIEGSSIRCPYHGWRFGPDGVCDDIPYHDGPMPRSAKLTSYPVEEGIGGIWMWFDEDGSQPQYPAPALDQWHQPQWIQWQMDHLGELPVQPQEVIDNMADARHLGPTHGAPCEYFENEWRDHIYIQRQGGFHKEYQAMLQTTTWYTGPGLLLSHQLFAEVESIEFIANTPVEDGVTKLWHGVLVNSGNSSPGEAEREQARQIQAGALDSLASDFGIWQNKRAATRVLQLKSDGPFARGRRWYKQFYQPVDQAKASSIDVNGVCHIPGLDEPPAGSRAVEEGFSSLHQ